MFRFDYRPGEMPPRPAPQGADSTEVPDFIEGDEEEARAAADLGALQAGWEYERWDTTKRTERGLRSWEWPVSPPHDDPWTPAGEEAG
jgi:hypothetical protein